MIERIPAEKLLRRCAAAIGYTGALPQGNAFAERLADAVNDALRAVWAKARWPQLMVHERRWYRPPWSAGAPWVEGQECWCEGAYWRATRDAPEDAPGAGGGWRKLDLADVAKFVALDQPWHPHRIGIRGVDLATFAFARDPRLVSGAEPLEGCAWMGDVPGGGATRVRLPPDAPESVVVRYLPEPPQVTHEAWASGQTYLYGDLALHDGDAWRCVAESTRDEPGGACERLAWERQVIPAFMLECLRLHVRAAFLEDDQGRERAWGRCQQALDALREQYCGGTGAFDRCAVAGFDGD